MALNTAWGVPLTWNDLSPRQQDVMLGIARGLSNQEIADELGISLSTVRNNVAALYEKLELANRVEAVLWVLAHEDLAAGIMDSL